jgi:hypothetical protein
MSRCVLFSVLLVFASACAPAQSTQTTARERAVLTPASRTSAASVQASAWPEVTLFHRHGAWVGADSAYSIDLGKRRVLWLFADTFIDPAADGLRDNGPNFFLRNSVGIQTGPDEQSAYDMTRAQMTFTWGPLENGVPTSFFRDAMPNDATTGTPQWVWPLHGARLPSGALVIFRMRMAHVPGPLGFALRAWDVVRVDDPDLEPAAWQPRVTAGPVTSYGVLLGSSVMIDGEHLYVYGVKAEADEHAKAHAIVLARFSLDALAENMERTLADPEWYFGDAGFLRQSESSAHAHPALLVQQGQVELSVHRDAVRERYVWFQMQGVFAGEASTQIGVRYAQRPEGPWSELELFHRPEEASRKDAKNLVAYAAKAHPEQRAQGADVVLTYVVNDLTRAPDDGLYYPKPVRVRFVPLRPGEVRSEYERMQTEVEEK